MGLMFCILRCYSIMVWVNKEWIEVSLAARKTRRYRLSAEYRRNIGKNVILTQESHKLRIKG